MPETLRDSIHFAIDLLQKQLTAWPVLLASSLENLVLSVQLWLYL